jgi:pilus assembly protein Flp/PilA
MGLVTKQFAAQDDGATAIEYALIASLISIAIVGVLSVINQDMIGIFNYIGDNLGPALGGE